MLWLRRGTIAVLLVVVAAAVALGIYGRRVLPQTNGVVTVDGARAELRIERDADGIPTIHAASIDDAMFGLGYAHAQDRLWQLETQRRVGAGRLAEAFGPPAIDADRFLRALGVRRAAAAQWEQLPGTSRSAMLAYAAGINAWIGHGLKARPPEFMLLGIKPEPWDPVDSMAWAIMMAWDLGANWSTELLRMRLLLKLAPERVEQLLPPYPGEAPQNIGDYAAMLREWRLGASLDDDALNRLAQAAPASGIEGIGSNNWVVAGAHTASGKPLLANDPHLKLAAPALWYLARIDAPGLHVAGATLPGLPFVVLGQNDDVAWGFTNTGADVQDLYLERLDPENPNRYQTPEGWAVFERINETIRVRGAADVTMTARRSRHGPVISDASGVVESLTGAAGEMPRFALALRWLALDPDPKTIEAGLAIDRSKSVGEFIAAAQHSVAPMQNMVVADRAGRIGFIAAGRVPLRKPENELKGLVPAPGWAKRYDWDGFAESTRTPREVDPPRGWIATANQRIQKPGDPLFLTSDWALPYRADRIEALLAAEPRHTAQSFEAMQADVQSAATARLLPYLKRAQTTHALAAAARAELADFDGAMDANRAAPLIFQAWARQLTQGIFADELGQALYERVIAGRSLRDALEGVLARDDAWWCDDKTTAQVSETCAQQIDAAFGRALDELNERFGANVAAWRWGAAHQARLEHRPFSRIKAMAPLFELRAPVGGDTYTVNAGRVSLKPDATTGELYLDEHGPSLRAIYDLGDPAQSRVMQSSGQSGIVFSPLYRRWVEPWARVDYVPLWPQEPARDTLVIKPKR